MTSTFWTPSFLCIAIALDCKTLPSQGACLSKSYSSLRKLSPGPEAAINHTTLWSPTPLCQYQLCSIYGFLPLNYIQVSVSSTVIFFSKEQRNESVKGKNKEILKDRKQVMLITMFPYYLFPWFAHSRDSMGKCLLHEKQQYEICSGIKNSEIQRYF